MGGGTTTRRWSNLAFAALFALSFFVAMRVLWPFLIPVLLAGFLVVLMTPAHRQLQRLLGKGARSAAVSTVAVLGLVCLPMVAVVWLVGWELSGLAVKAQALLDGVDLDGGRLKGLGAALEQAAPSVLGRAAEVLSGLVIAGTGLAIDGFLMGIALYYFFLDGPRLLAEVGRLLPIEERYFEAFCAEVKGVTRAILFGSSVTAAAQGAAGLVGFYLAGVPHPAVWALAMSLTAMIPIGGTLLVWVPVGIALILGGQLWAGVFVLGWGAVVIGAIDSFLRPRLCGSRMAMHPLLVFVSLFGGLAAFGPAGLLVGPLAFALFMSMVRIYRRDFLTSAGAPITSAPGLARNT